MSSRDRYDARARGVSPGIVKVLTVGSALGAVGSGLRLVDGSGDLSAWLLLLVAIMMTAYFGYIWRRQHLLSRQAAGADRHSS